MTKGRFKTSARLRATERVADGAGFKYDSKRYRYGGFFTGWELEQIADKLEELKRLQKARPVDKLVETQS